MGFYKYPKEVMLSIIRLYMAGNHSFEQLGAQFKIHKSTIKEWCLKFEVFGECVFDDHFPQRQYTKEQKLLAVNDYLTGDYSLYELMMKHQISGRTILMKWVKKYTGHRELKDSGKGMSQTMTKGRKTTVEEKIQIAQECLMNGKNYQEIATKYQVSYQQVYQWVKKYEVSGEHALEDRRGRKKSEEERTESEKLQLKIKQIERENERLRAENLLLKKLEELERRHR